MTERLYTYNCKAYTYTSQINKLKKTIVYEDLEHTTHKNNHFSPFNVYNWHSSYIGQHIVMRKLDKTV